MLPGPEGAVMAAPGWWQWVLAAAMAAVAGYHLSRLVARRVPTRVDVELSHVAMGVVMVAMLLGLLAPLDNLRLAAAFAVAVVWFACVGVHTYVMDGATPRARALAGPAVGSAVMVYMLTAPAGSSAMAGMAHPGSGSAGGLGALDGVLVLVLVVPPAWTAARNLLAAVDRLPGRLTSEGCEEPRRCGRAKTARPGIPMAPRVLLAEQRGRRHRDRSGAAAGRVAHR
jgi:hypothetical protein